MTLDGLLADVIYLMLYGLSGLWPMLGAGLVYLALLYVLVSLLQGLRRR